MGNIRNYLETSELGALEKVFPALTVPEIAGNTSTDYMKTIAEAAIEQIKFLNAFADIPLEVLYENIGQRHRASNALAVSLLRELPGGTGEGLDMIRVQGETSGSYENALIAGIAAVETMTTEEIQPIWDIQNDWIDAEIERLQKMMGMLERAETVAIPDMDDETSRGLWTWILKLKGLAARLEPHIATAIAFLEFADAAITVGSFAYSIYQRFVVEKETLRNLPKVLIQLCKMTIDLLRQLREIPVSAVNFEMRQSMTTDLTERLEQQMQFFITGQNQLVGPSTSAAGMEQINDALTNLNTAIESLTYTDTDIDIGALRVSTRSRLITTT